MLCLFAMQSIFRRTLELNQAQLWLENKAASCVETIVANFHHFCQGDQIG
jgi:hypothetical protein